MYLKNLEMIGFKSFADRTKLDFLPGMTAIVGPNGCGKSNISDGIRWVLGEQSAKAMRGSQMADCIFSGTDARKPLGMAEVSLTFAGCEKALGVEYEEVTITRRVFRDGQGEYFINKTPCRLKDIQRLFMGTGVGTSSYSFMEQGKIDRILSSRPEDRRAVFEEASGITKYKSDRKEALRKLEQTEANLLRLTDVIAEVKRQIGSLQRQAGKARRYQTLREELRVLDLYVSRQRLTGADQTIADLTGRIETLSREAARMHGDIAEMESGAHVVREALVTTEREIGSTTEAATQAQGRLEHTRELIATDRLRIQEYGEWSKRDQAEAEQLGRQVEEQRLAAEAVRRSLDQISAQLNTAASELSAATSAFTVHQQETETCRAAVQRLRDESMVCDGASTRLQGQLAEVDTREGANVRQRERLAAEKLQLARVAEQFGKRLTEMLSALAELKRAVEEKTESLRSAEAARKDTVACLQKRQKELAAAQSEAAAVKSRLDTLREQEAAREGFASGARLMLDPANPLGAKSGAVLGALASRITVEPSYQIAVEAVLRSWLDAVVVVDVESAMDLLAKMEQANSGAARILAANTEPVDLPDESQCAARNSVVPVTADDELAPLLARLFADVHIVDRLDCVPRPIPYGSTYVTLTGTVVRGDGSFERWVREAGASNPLARHHAIEESSRLLESAEAAIAGLQDACSRDTREIAGLDERISELRSSLGECRDAFSRKQGESQLVENEAREAGKRLETVSWEHEQICSQSAAGQNERRDIADQLEKLRLQRETLAIQTREQTEALYRLEAAQNTRQQELMEKKLQHSSLSQTREHTVRQATDVENRLRELEASLAKRAESIASYASGVERMTAEIASAEQQLASLEEAVRVHSAKTESLRRNRERQSEELAAMESQLAEKRSAFEARREEQSRLDVQLAENRMRRQNLADRVTGEYSVSVEDILRAETPPPSGEDGQAPSTVEAMETQIAELRTKIEAMGPVNLVAIDEYKELEERHAFLTAQEDDLQKSKKQLMDLIREINKTTTDMFSQTFEKVNANFQVMFAKLFNGGTAKLVLVNEEDVLECGIEIIARPPGKRLQNVSLLSGGERTMTAVALLFSIYMIKPSPFCLLDELDAALDDSNIGRFVKVLKDFLEQSQFVVITHNRQTISASDVLYGVTMPERGISKIVSMKFTENPARGALEPVK